MVPVSAYLILAAVLFGVGAVGVLTCRNVIILFMSTELMLNAANLALIAFLEGAANYRRSRDCFPCPDRGGGRDAVGLAIIIMIYRNRETINIDRFSILKW